MKIGYLVWMYGDDEVPELHKHEPDYAHKVVMIVYMEVEND